MRALVVAIAGSIILAISSPAHGASIPVVYQSGQQAFPSGPLPEPYASQPAYAGFSGGYVCDVTGVFYSYVSIDDCKPAAVQGDRYDDSATLGAAIAAKYGAPAIPFWAAHGWKLLAGLIVLGVAVVAVRRRRPRRADVDDDSPDLTRKVRPLALPKQQAVSGTIHASDDLEGRTVPARLTAAEALEMHQRHGLAFDQQAAIHRYERMHHPHAPASTAQELARGSYTPYAPDADEGRTTRGWAPRRK